MKFTVFISHSNKDEEEALIIRNYLENLGYSCFVAGRDLKHNSGWQKQLVQAMENSFMLLYLHSRNANLSEEVGREVNYFADRCHRPILVYRLDDIEYSYDRAYYLQSLNYIDSLISAEEGLAQLGENVNSCIQERLPAPFRPRPGTAKKSLRKITVGLMALFPLSGLVAGELLYIESMKKEEQKQAAVALSKCTRYLSKASTYLVFEDSLELILPYIDKADSVMSECSKLHFVTPRKPDFDSLRNDCRNRLYAVRKDRTDEVLDLYSNMEEKDAEDREIAGTVILEDIKVIHKIDSILHQSRNNVIMMIYERINADD